MNQSVPLRVVDVDTLSEEHRRLLAPDAAVEGPQGELVRHPRYFYEIGSWQTAIEVQLSAHFGLWEFLDVDVREAPLLRTFPRYVPCAVSVLAVHLELLRQTLGAAVRIATNGGYRSPAHEATTPGSPHAWGTAANIFCIGSDDMTERATVDRYAEIAHRVLPSAWCRPFGPERGQTIDHLHIDLGYITVIPREPLVVVVEAPVERTAFLPFGPAKRDAPGDRAS